VNLFIGGPNAGKSNILETLGLLSSTIYRDHKKFVRFESPSNLFYDDVLDNPIEIKGTHISPEKQSEDFKFEFAFKANAFEGRLWRPSGQWPILSGDYQTIYSTSSMSCFSYIKSYRYSDRTDFPSLQADFLWPPDGENLFSLIKAKTSMRDLLIDLLSAFGLKPMLRVKEQKIELTKQLGELLITYPYGTASDTVKRMIFYLAAIESNKNSTIVLEEPESKTFPFYTKDLAERIGRDQSNQYFISTHNPYFLETVTQKTKSEELAVFVTYMKNYETKVRPLNMDEISALLDTEPFFNLDQFTKE
jgi:predicted ATPase